MRALYALTGDPPTNGHIWIINEMAKMADEIHIALAYNQDKTCLFNIEERMDMMTCLTKGLQIIGKKIVMHDIQNEFLVRFACKNKCTHLVRGIRSVKDYEYERTMAQVNYDLEPSITTLFLFPPPNLEAVSSSFVKGLMKLQDWQDVAAKYVHPFVLEKLVKKVQP